MATPTSREVMQSIQRLTWWLGADTGISTYSGQFLKKESQKWVDENAADHKDDILGYYFSRWDDYEKFKYVIDQARNASGLVFKTIPANPKPCTVDDELYGNVEILIDLTQPNLEEKLDKATNLLLGPFREHAHQVAQKTIETLRNIESRIKPAQAKDFADHVDALEKFCREAIDDALGKSASTRLEFSTIAHIHLVNIANLDYGNDTLVAACYRAEGQFDALAYAVGTNRGMTQENMRAVLDRLQFPDPMKAHLEAGKAKGA